MNFNDVLDAALLRAFLARWRLLLVIEFAFLILTLVLFTLLPRQYMVTATVIGTRYSGDVTPSSAPATFTASALLGRSVNNLPAVTDFNLFAQFLSSRELGSTLTQDPILGDIFPIARDGSGAWRPLGTPGQRVKGFLNAMAERPEWTAPDGFAISSQLGKVLSIVPDKDTQMLTLTYVGTKPEVGVRLISLVQRRADILVKQMAQVRLRDKVAFLQKQIAATSVQETRMVLANTLAKAETDRLYSFSNLPFAAEFLAPPAAASDPVSPSFLSTVGIGLILGLAFFTLYVLYDAKLRRPAVRARDDKLAPGF